MELSGFGIGLRDELASALLETKRSIDWLEIVAENWVGVGGVPKRTLERCAERWPLVLHGVTMSIGGPAPLDPTLFRQVTALCHELDAPFWSDHVCYANVRGHQFGDLYPLPFSDEALGHVLSRIALARTMTDVPLVFENPSYYAKMPGCTMGEAAFLRSVIEQSGAGLLLDVNNVYVNSQNHGYDPEAFIRALPLQAVRQIHLAGHTRRTDVIVDTHSTPVAEEVWTLYRHALRCAGRMIPTLLEWDAQIPALDEVVDQLDRARAEARVALAELEEAA